MVNIIENKEDINSFIQLLRNDAEVLYKHLNDNYSLSYELSQPDISLFFDFDLFIELVKTSCFENKSKTVKIPAGIVQKDQKQSYIEWEYVPVPDERKRLFVNIFMPNFKEGVTIKLSRVGKSTSTPLDFEDFYYRLFYAFFNRYIREKRKDAQFIFRDLYQVWKNALDNDKMLVQIGFDLEGINLKNSESYSYNDKFTIKKIKIAHIKKSTEGGISTDSPQSFVKLTLKTDLTIKVRFSPIMGDSAIREEFKNYREEYGSRLRTLYLFVCAFYLNNFIFTWKSSKIELPWYFEPLEYQEISERNNNTPLLLSKKSFENIASTYKKICDRKVGEEEEILLDSLFRTYQHQEINIYFFVDIFTFFESLFTRGSNEYTNLRLKLNGASFYANEINTFWEIYNFLGFLYNIRSRAVHGGKWYILFENHIKKSNTTMSDDTFTEEIAELRNRILLYMNKGLLYIVDQRLEDSNFSEELNNDTLFFFHNSEFIKQNKNRQKILNELQKRYDKEKINYKNKWDEITDKFKF